MTSIEWLIEQCPRILTIASYEVIEQSKEMHKQEIIASRMLAMTEDELSYLNAEQYYNQTFKKD